jgi:hypothetical protein
MEWSLKRESGLHRIVRFLILIPVQFENARLAHLDDSQSFTNQQCGRRPRVSDFGAGPKPTVTGLALSRDLRMGPPLATHSPPTATQRL